MANPGNDEKDDQNPVFNHFSHEHSLSFVTTSDPTNPVDVTCSGCNIGIIPGKPYFSCKTCGFALHGVCYKMKRTIQHRAEPSHELILVFLPSFECRACGDPGSGFGYVCNVCSYVYHGLCMSKPDSTSYDYHPHRLNLTFSDPYRPDIGFRCDVCQFPGCGRWLYRCAICEFDAHLSCALSNKPPSQINQRIVEPVGGKSTNSSTGSSDRTAVVRTSSVASPAVRTNTERSPIQHLSFPHTINVGLQPTNQRFRFENQTGFGWNEGRMNGNNIVGTAVSSFGQGMFQEILHTVFAEPGNTGSPSPDPSTDFSDLSGNWFGDSDYY